MKLNVFVSSRKDGIMANDQKYFPTLTTEERNLLYETTLARFFAKKNIKYENVYILTEKNVEIKARTITKTTKRVKEAIFVLKDTTKDLCVAAETSDFPIIIASAKDNNNHTVAAIAQGTLRNLNNNLLHEIIEALIKETNAAPFEMTFYIGACPSKEKLIVDMSELTNNNVWKDAIIKKKKEYYLDIRYAIFNTLIKEIVDPNNIYFDEIDTTTDERYFSKIGNKPGKNLVCVEYIDEEV